MLRTFQNQQIIASKIWHNCLFVCTLLSLVYLVPNRLCPVAPTSGHLHVLILLECSPINFHIQFKDFFFSNVTLLVRPPWAPASPREEHPAVLNIYSWSCTLGRFRGPYGNWTLSATCKASALTIIVSFQHSTLTFLFKVVPTLTALTWYLIYFLFIACFRIPE